MLQKTLVAPMFVIALAAAFSVNAASTMGAGMMTGADDHTAREEAEGKAVWERIQANETRCAALTDDDFGALGEYFMGLMTGDAHAAMNAMMERAHGEAGEEAMHVVMGKRISGCDPNAAFAQGQGFGPMMMSSGASDNGSGSWGMSSRYGGFPMMNGGGMGWGYAFSPIMFVWWALAITGVVFLVRWLLGRDRRGGSGLAILEERLAKGEITKEQYAETKRIIQT